MCIRDRWKAARWGAALALLAQVVGLNAWAWTENRAIAAKQVQVRSTLATSSVSYTHLTLPTTPYV